MRTHIGRLWESPELKLLIYSRFSNSRTADVEYLVTNIRRLEPPAELFEVPVDYTLWTVVDTEKPLMDFFPPEHRRAQAR